jgi:hypothetical protein
MDKKLFGQLVESMEQMGEITRGERAPSREFCSDSPEVAPIPKSPTPIEVGASRYQALRIR